ncbi:BQ2448_6651 [Microbotryum intermedium]|uniref:BQ2448_6651 protein n=1 Tax=Microbotryum intermedium TaxID=269621 RepID=A0A238FN50_9BASI|nr:BQ2448_6651 [Microbotryum intermedium]
MFSKLRRKHDSDADSAPVERSTNRASESEPPPLYADAIARNGEASSSQQQQQQPQALQSYSDNKGSQPVFHQQPQQVYNDAPPSSFGHEVVPLQYHVYRAPGKFRDEVVTDRETILFYVDYSVRLSGSHTEIHRGGKDGPLVCTASQGWTTTKTITMSNGWTTQLFRTNALTCSHEYFDFDGQSLFKWVVDRFTNDFTLTTKAPDGSKFFVAKWDCSYFSFSKEGKLFISPAFTSEIELIVTTGLSVAEWLRSRQRWASG